MRILEICLLLFAAIASADQPLTDAEIQRQAANIADTAAKEPPLMALDTLLKTAVLIRPYIPAESKRIFLLALGHGDRNPSLTISNSIARDWMDLDPAGGESGLRKLTGRRRVLEALSAYYQSKDDPERAASLAAEAIRIDDERRSQTSSLMRTVAARKPLAVIELLALPHVEADPNLPGTLMSALEGLLKASDAQAADAKRASDTLEPVVSRMDFAGASVVVTTSSKNNAGVTVKTADSRAALLETLALVRRAAEPATRTAALETMRTRSVTYSMDRSTSRPPVDANLPLKAAIEEIRRREPAYQQLGELWRYIQGKQRTPGEATPMIATLVKWTEEAGPKSDPGWFLQSLLNLDNRLGPRGRQWILPADLRPVILRSAARTHQRLDKDPDQFVELASAARAEKIDVPEELVSLRSRILLDTLRTNMETRYDFSLPALDQTSLTLQSLRGKVVLINFWATWCAPCRAELPVLEGLQREFYNKGLTILAISDEGTAQVKGFTAKNPIALRVLLDEKRDVFRHYNIVGLPQSYILDKDGRLVRHFTMEATAVELRTAIIEALSARASN